MQRAEPEKYRINCATSVQITAFIPPSNVYTSTSAMMRRTEVRCSGAEQPP